MMDRKKIRLDNTQIYQSVKGHPFFQGVAFQDAIELLSLCQHQTFGQAEIIYQANKPRQGLFLLLEGTAEVYVNSEDTLEVLEVVQNGDLIGFSSLADFLGVTENTTYEQMVEVRAVDEVSGLMIPFSVVEKRYKDTHIKDYLLKQVTSRLKDIYTSLAEQVKLSRQLGESKRFVMRVQEVMKTPPLTLKMDATIQQVAQAMSKHQTSSVLMLKDEKLVGIITERDLVDRVIATGKPITAKASEIMTRDPYTISRFSYFYDALSTMLLQAIKHLPVVNEQQRVVGVVTLNDLLRKRNESMMKTIQRIDTVDEQSLPQVHHGIYEVLETLIDDQVPMLHTLDVITRLYDRLAIRCIELAINLLKEKEGIEPPVSFCWYQMGSAARREQFILTDQDHFLVYENGDEKVDHYFKKLGKEIVTYLEKAGYARCQGNMMASEPNWRGSITRWQNRIRSWVLHSTNDNILLAQNLFSFRQVYGDNKLQEQFIETISEQLERSKIFLYRMAQLEKENQVPTLDQPIRSLFRLERKKIDMKKEVLFPFHHGLQILSLTYGIVAGTPLERIDQLVEKNVLTASFAADLKTAFDEVMMIYVKQKWQQHKRGEPVSSVLTFTHLTTREKEDLILTLKTFRQLQNQMLIEFST